MKKLTAPYLNLALPIALFLFSRCAAYHSYFQSPYQANSEPYHTIPLRSDSLKAATYVGGVFTVGGANSQIRDNVYSFNGSIYRSHNFGHFQGFYGAGFSLGSYGMGEFPGYGGSPPHRDTLPAGLRAGNQFFGGYAVTGGIDYVQSLGRGSEWRVIGLSFTLQKEFGDYWKFRKGLPDTLADAIFKNNLVGMLGVSTELAFKTRHNSVIGYKLMLVGDVLNRNPGSHWKGNDSTQFGMIYFQQSLSYTHNQVTGYFQFSVGNHAVNGQLGIGYRLGWGKNNLRPYALR